MNNYHGIYMQNTQSNYMKNKKGSIKGLAYLVIFLLIAFIFGALFIKAIGIIWRMFS